MSADAGRQISWNQRAEVPCAKAGLSERQIWEQFAAAVRGEGEPAVRLKPRLSTMVRLHVPARQSSRHQESSDVRDVVEWVY